MEEIYEEKVDCPPASFYDDRSSGVWITREEAQKVQKTSSLKIQAVYLECEAEEANPLLEDAVLEVNRAVEEHFAKMQEETGYVEAYHNLHVYTKEGKMRIHM